MKKSIIIGLHIGFWSCYFMMLLMMLGIYFRGDIPETRFGYYLEIIFGFALLPSAIAFYSFYYFIFPNYLQHKNVLLSIFYGLLMAFIASFLGGLSLTRIIDDPEIDFTMQCYYPLFPVVVVIALLSEVIGLLMKGFITWFEEIKLKEMLRQKNHQMELALVKSQLDPHFLFNTINNIDVLIIKNATEASNYLNRLSDIMRFMLFETKSDEILLSKELEYIDKYIELQKIRTANSNYVNFSVSGKPEHKTIAPMVFIPFIENAFKHTNNKKLNNAITINIIIENKIVKLECINKFDPHRKIKEKDHGLGNDLIQKRLNLIYPEQHILEVQKENDLYSVFLTIKLQNGKT